MRKKGTTVGGDMETKKGGQSYVFEFKRKVFWKQLSADEWIELNETHLRLLLQKNEQLAAKADPTKGQTIAPLDDRVLQIVERDRVDLALALPGFRPGVHTVQGWRVLVPRALQLVKPIKGEWPVIRALVDGMFGPGEQLDAEGRPIDQRDYFYAWVQHWLRQLYRGVVGRGLCLVIAGDRECGKTRIVSNVVKALVGGRAAKPYDYLIGRDNFNRKMFEASLQLIDDENADTSHEARREFGSRIKMFTSNDEMSMRAMHADGVDLNANLRLVILLNNEGEQLLVLPEMGNHLTDKMLMLLAGKRPRPAPTDPEEVRRCWPMPMPTGTDEEKEAFAAALAAELPAFAHFLLEEYEGPNGVTGGRLGVVAWQHPELLHELGQFAAYVTFWRMLHKSGVVFRVDKNADRPDAPAEWEDIEEWKGDAEALEGLLKSEGSKLSQEEKKKLPTRSWIGSRLKEASLAWGEGVAKLCRSGKERTWRLKRSPELCQ